MTGRSSRVMRARCTRHRAAGMTKCRTERRSGRPRPQSLPAVFPLLLQRSGRRRAGIGAAAEGAARCISAVFTAGVSAFNVGGTSRSSKATSVRHCTGPAAALPARNRAFPHIFGTATLPICRFPFWNIYRTCHGMSRNRTRALGAICKRWRPDQAEANPILRCLIPNQPLADSRLAASRTTGGIAR